MLLIRVWANWSILKTFHCWIWRGKMLQTTVQCCVLQCMKSLRKRRHVDIQSTWKTRHLKDAKCCKKVHLLLSSPHKNSSGPCAAGHHLLQCRQLKLACWYSPESATIWSMKYSHSYLSHHTRTRVLHVEQLIFWGCGRFPFITSFSSQCSSIMLWSLAHMFSLYTAMTYLLESLERFRRRVSDMICMRFSTLSASSDSHEPWGILNILSQPFSYHFKWIFSQQVLAFFWK